MEKTIQELREQIFGRDCDFEKVDNYILEEALLELIEKLIPEYRDSGHSTEEYLKYCIGWNDAIRFMREKTNELKVKQK